MTDSTIWDFLTNVMANYFAAVLLAVSVVLVAVFRKRLLAGLSSVYQSFAIGLARFMAYGFRLWAERTVHSEHDDDLWNWVGDQVLAAQHRHAFAFGCVIFRRNSSGILETLLIRRNFSGFRDRVLLWPGGRIRGLSKEESLLGMIESIVEQEARCNVRLVGPMTSDEVVISVGCDRQATVKNQINPAPVLIMRQNRMQRNGVPGHVDLIFVAEFVSALTVSSDAYETAWLTLDQVNSFPEQWVLWPDTREVITRTSRWYENWAPKLAGPGSVQ